MHFSFTEKKTIAPNILNFMGITNNIAFEKKNFSPYKEANANIFFRYFESTS